MRIIESITEMQQSANTWNQSGKRIALVPTMGYLHEGHVALMRAVRKRADVVVTSIFVNPTQFGPGEDYERYPRDLDRDTNLAAGAGVDFIFAPPAAEMYPEDYQTFVDVTKVTLPLCGKSRPIHFRGVTTVVSKLFNIVKPHMAIFGQKDFQQLVTIRRMVQDLNLDVEIIAHSTVREEDGLAMSSRNAYLTSEQRLKAVRLSQSLQAAQELVESGERSGEAILKKVNEVLGDEADMRADYIQLRHPQTLEEVVQVNGPTLLALAIYVGVARLIDNRVLQPTA